MCIIYRCKLSVNIYEWIIELFHNLYLTKFVKLGYFWMCYGPSLFPWIDCVSNNKNKKFSAFSPRILRTNFQDYLWIQNQFAMRESPPAHTFYWPYTIKGRFIRIYNFIYFLVRCILCWEKLKNIFKKNINIKEIWDLVYNFQRHK